jgi:hypothetical protein
MSILPLIESVSEISSDRLLSISDILHPVLCNLSHFDKELPSVKSNIFLWVSFAVMLKASNNTSHKSFYSFVSQVTYLADLIRVKPFFSHEVFQISDI